MADDAEPLCPLCVSTGADNSKDDGVYSAYFIGFAGEGTYRVTLEVENVALGQAKRVTFPHQAPSGLMPYDWGEWQGEIPVESHGHIGPGCANPEHRW